MRKKLLFGNLLLEASCSHVFAVSLVRVERRSNIELQNVSNFKAHCSATTSMNRFNKPSGDVGQLTHYKFPSYVAKVEIKIRMISHACRALNSHSNTKKTSETIHFLNLAVLGVPIALCASTLGFSPFWRSPGAWRAVVCSVVCSWTVLLTLLPWALRRTNEFKVVNQVRSAQVFFVLKKRHYLLHEACSNELMSYQPPNI